MTQDSRDRLGRNLLVTGLPRSGTTLLAALLDSAPEVVCLSEPDLPRARATRDPVLFPKVLAEEMAALRRDLVSGASVEERRGDDGTRVTNYWERRADGSKALVASRQQVSRPPQPSHFTFGIKLNALFMANLPSLASSGAFECVGLIRGPRETFLSWVNTDLPAAYGGFAANRWAEMATIGRSGLSRSERLAAVYAVGANRLAGATGVKLLRYEDLIADPNGSLTGLGVADCDIGQIGEAAMHAPSSIVDDAMSALKQLGGAAANLYPL